MKIVLSVFALTAMLYWGWDRYRAAQPKTWAYAEFRVAYPNGMELVGVGRMDSAGDCERHADEYWRRAFVANSDARITPASCSAEMPIRYDGLFERRVIAATYVAIDRGNENERDGRFIIYGLPSSEGMNACPGLVEGLQRKFKGRIACIQGSVG